MYALYKGVFDNMGKYTLLFAYTTLIYYVIMKLQPTVGELS